MKELLEYLARSLVDNPDSVWVEVEEEDDEVTLRSASMSATWGG